MLMGGIFFLTSVLKYGHSLSFQYFRSVFLQIHHVRVNGLRLLDTLVLNYYGIEKPPMKNWKSWELEKRIYLLQLAVCIVLRGVEDICLSGSIFPEKREIADRADIVTDGWWFCCFPMNGKRKALAERGTIS